MDGSFLSHESVVAASRNFVCIRLATYEDQQEAEFMSRVFTPRSGVLENTTFGILSPDGKRNLITPGRAPKHAFRDATSMANKMNLIALQHPGARQAAWTDQRLPGMNSVDVALNVAACDNLPVLVTFAENEQRLAEINKSLLKIAWSEPLAGQFVYGSTSNQQKLKPIPGVNVKEGILVVEPGPYGLTGKILRELPGIPTSEQSKAELLQAVASFSRVAPEYTSHIQLGIQLGIDWESAIPETDQQSIRAKERARAGR
ncbi:MAG: thioredoxin family protein [Planctomycetota bacterium]|nr:thioredoxin family protein [Planctomycetota bacterium]